MQKRAIDEKEIAKFSALAEEWWDPEGKFKPLHKFNPTRLGFIRDQICRHFNRNPMDLRPLSGLHVLDIGCGGGLLCEPLCRLGAQVTGVDAAVESVQTAKAHALEMGLDIEYRAIQIETLQESGARFDVVLTMEVIEHVPDVDHFLKTAGSLMKPEGLFFLATLNRTPKSFLYAILGAEYILRWLPRGTHDWKKFVKPSEAARPLRGAGLYPQYLTGVVYNPIKDQWVLNSRDLAVNYMGVFAQI